MGETRQGTDEVDGSLVARVLEGDQRAYGIIVDRYLAEFGRYATALCQDADLAADAMQESFIRAYDALESLDDANRFGAWFFRILTNQCHNHRDRHRSHMSLEAVTVSGRDNPERHMTAVEIREAMNRALDELTPDLREAFVLREVEGRPYAEIAKLLQVNEAALRKRVERAKDTVRPALEELL